MKYHQPALLSLIIISVCLMVCFSSCNPNPTDKDFEEFITNFEKKYIPLKTAIEKADYNAAVTGSEEDYKESTELNIELTELFSSKRDFKMIQKFKNSSEIHDPIFKSEIDILYNLYHFHQLDPKTMKEIVEDSKQLTKKFNAFRTNVDGQLLSDNQVEEELCENLNSDLLEKVWKGSKMAGALVAEDMITLVKKRNEAARSIGFKNYFDLKLQISGQNPDQLEEIYEGFNVLTEGIYIELKKDMDERLSVIYSVPVGQLMPWHYQNRFFQKAPYVYNVNLNKYYKDIDQLKVATNFFKGIGLDLVPILNKSDLFDKPGKIQTARSYDIDRNGDVRIVMNLSEDENSMNTLLYEAGFSLYLENISKELPFLLREPSNFCTNDAVAVMFSQFSSDPAWLKEVVGISSEEKELICNQNSKYIVLSKLVFSRWAQVMYHFEKEMYNNPDQDLNTLWWGMVEKYQKINKPKDWNNPDWAAKNHLITMPCTYHNYILGELFAAQLKFYIQDKITKHDKCEVKCINNKEVGEFLIDKVFRPGKTLNWEELIKYATGEELDPDYFKRAIVNIAVSENNTR